VADALLWSGWTLAGLGALLALLGAIGVLRFPDVYSRIHAASITDTGGASLMLLGLGLLSGLSIVTLKLAVIWAFIMLTSPTAAHTLANAAYSSGLAPWIGAFRIMRGEQKPETRGPGPRKPGAHGP
jgi:multicomponent Na+:H+ antiporter subunit G